MARPGAPDWPRRTEEPADGCILFFGTLEPRKNVAVLLDAYERLLATHANLPRLVLAGGIDRRGGPADGDATQLAPLRGPRRNAGLHR